MFDRHRKARLLTLPFPPLILGLLVLFFDRNLETQGWLLSIADLTHSLITPVFVICLVALGVVLAVALLAGNLATDDIGLDRDFLGRGVAITVMTWAAVQVIGVLPRVVAEDPIAIHRVWEDSSGFALAGNFLAALGFASVREVALRGFLLVQLYLLFHRDPKNSYQGLGWAVAITIVVGNLALLPALLPFPSSRDLVLAQAIAAGWGLYLSMVYLRTRNLFFTIGVHGLIIAPTPVVAGLRGEPGWFFPVVVAVVAGIWVLLWPRRD